MIFPALVMLHNCKDVFMVGLIDLHYIICISVQPASESDRVNSPCSVI